MSWCPSYSNSLWQGWSCGLVHSPGGNATASILRVLASSDGISCWTPLKPQHSNPKPTPLINQLWCSDFLTHPTPLTIPHRLPAFLESPMPQKLILDSCNMAPKQSDVFHTFLWDFFQFKNRILLHVVLLKCPHIQIAFLKLTCCDNEVLVFQFVL